MPQIKIHLPQIVLLVWATIELFTEWLDNRFWMFSGDFDIDILFKIVAIMVLIILTSKSEFFSLKYEEPEKQ